MRRYRNLVAHHRMLINLTDGSAIDGLLWDERPPLLVIRDARLHAPGADAPTPLDGEIVVDAARIAFVQVMTS